VLSRSSSGGRRSSGAGSGLPETPPSSSSLAWLSPRDVVMQKRHRIKWEVPCVLVARPAPEEGRTAGPSRLGISLGALRRARRSRAEDRTLRRFLRSRALLPARESPPTRTQGPILRRVGQADPPIRAVRAPWDWHARKPGAPRAGLAFRSIRVGGGQAGPRSACARAPTKDRAVLRGGPRGYCIGRWPPIEGGSSSSAAAAASGPSVRQGRPRPRGRRDKSSAPPRSGDAMKEV
jgi:hypothetical protein